MDEIDIFKLSEVKSDDKDYPPTGQELKTGAVSRVGIYIYSNGESPGYAFVNTSGESHSRIDGKDHFSPGQSPSLPKTHRIRFSIMSTVTPEWSIDETCPIRFIDRSVTDFYYAEANTPKSFTLSVTENTTYPQNCEHIFNLYVLEQRSDGSVIRRKIDPIVDNPPK